MSWTTSDLERWLRNAGKEKTIFFSFVDGKFSTEVEDADGYVEGRSATLGGAIEQAMTKLQQRAYKETKIDVPPVAAPPAPAGTSYPTCSACRGAPTIVYCDGRSECHCGARWTMQLSRGTRVKLTNGHVYEFDGALWDIAVP